MINSLRRCLGLLAALLVLPALLQAQASPDEPAAVLVFPYIAVDGSAATDTVIQISNTTNQPVEARCFYENFTPQCSSGQSDATCIADPPTCTGVCIPRDLRIPLRVRLTSNQPLAWRVSSGLQQLPIPEPIPPPTGINMSNQFTSIPGLGGDPFIGTLHCTAVSDDPLQPSLHNALVGQATIGRFQGQPAASADAAQYRAVGIKSLADRPNRDEFLAFGGSGAEYEACPAYASLNHFFDGAPVHAGESTAAVTTTLVLANCSGTPPVLANSVVQFLVFNEFDQRFSTSHSMAGQMVKQLSHIDTTTSNRSIFWYQVTGTLAGHTLIQGVPIGSTAGGGLHVVAIESHSAGDESSIVHSDAINAHGYGQRLQGDVLSYRPPICVGDCNFDGNVTVDEVITGVNIALEEQVVTACPIIDRNADNQVTVDEIVGAILAAGDGCPEPVLPTPGEGSPPVPTPPAPSSAGPDITHFGVATADDRALQPDTDDDSGRPVFVRPFGQGMTLVIETRPGQSLEPISGASTYDPTGGLPDLQLLVSHPLGDGGAEVCENEGLSGGIPAVPSLEFTTDAATIAAINDFGCRAYDRASENSRTACTRIDGASNGGPFGFGFVSPVSTAQFCIPIAKAWAFPLGDTIVAVKVRDRAGNLSTAQEIVVRVQH